MSRAPSLELGAFIDSALFVTGDGERDSCPNCFAVLKEMVGVIFELSISSASEARFDRRPGAWRWSNRIKRSLTRTRTSG